MNRLIFFIICVTILPGILFAQTLEQDTDALIALYNSTDGANWSSTWDLEAAVDTWFGVMVSGGRVTELSLGGNNLIGTIPIELGNLTNLIFLLLNHNQLSDTIPAELGNLSNLDLLLLNNNQLTGSIPSELGSLTTLTWLYLFSNQLTGTIPSELGSMTNLIRLYLRSNQLTGSIPVELGSLANLQQLQLHNNQLTGTIPTELGSLTNLTILYLRDNDLTGSIPIALGSLSNLTDLQLYGNQLTGSIPSELGSLTNLTTLLLRSNLLTGSIPVELGNLTNLIFLELWSNQLTGSIPIELGNLTNLTSLRLYSNQLTGSIPVELGNLSNLTEMSLYVNELSGSIPAELGSLTNLTALRLYSNQFTGSVPVEIANLTNLTDLRFNSNLLTELPDLSALSVLIKLQVEQNRLTFEDIEPNIDVASTTFTYSPQDSVGREIDTSAIAGSNLTLTVAVGGTANQYQWLKDGVNISGATNDSYTLSNIQNDDEGDYNLRITNTIATSLTLYGRIINVTVVDTTAPAVPQNLKAVAFGDSVQLVWDPNSEPDLSYYTIFRDTTSDSTASDSITSLLKPDTNYTDTSVNVGITYYYWVTAVDSSGNESGYSMGISAFTNASPVWTLSDTSFFEDDSLVLDLDDWVSDQNDDDSTLTLTVSGGNKISAVIDALTHVIKFETDQDSSGFSEQFILTATDSFGLSTEDAISVSVLPIADDPSNFSLTSPLGDTLNTLLPTFSWNPSIDPDSGSVIGYQISISTAETMESPIYTAQLTDTSHSLTVPLADDTKYYWAVSARDTALPQKIDFQTQIEPIFTNNCTSRGCHITGNTGGGLNLQVGNSYAEITGANTTDNAPLVIADDPDISPLIWKLEGKTNTGANVFGSRMPLSGGFLVQSTIDLIRDWISEGATPSADDSSGVSVFSDTSYFLLDKQESPSEFSLISPEDNSAIDSLRPVFKWERSTDPDPLDAVRYTFIIRRPTGPDSIVYKIEGIEDTTYQVMEEIEIGSYEWFVLAEDSDEDSLDRQSSEIFSLSVIVGIEDDLTGIPKEYDLSQNYPNPFNPSTVIRYALPKSSSVSLVIYNLMGQEVMRWDVDDLSLGFYEITWNGMARTGIPVSSGMYIYRLQAGEFSRTKKMVLLK